MVGPEPEIPSPVLVAPAVGLRPRWQRNLAGGLAARHILARAVDPRRSAVRIALPRPGSRIDFPNSVTDK
jgi:hypothetical protein